MNINILAIGKLSKSSSCAAIIADYLKRIPWPINIKEYEEKKPYPRQKMTEIESNMLLANLKPNSLAVMLDAGGAEMSSEEFAKHLSSWQESKYSSINFLIGGADGHSDLLKKQSNVSLSLSKMTLPHMLARTVLVEQLYRAYAILTNHPYHK